MRFVLFIALLAGCDSHDDVPVGGTTAEGTFISMTPIGDYGDRTAITYADKNGVVRNDVYQIGNRGGNTSHDGSERLVLKEPIYPGNHFSIVKAGESKEGETSITIYAIKKLE